MTTATETPRKPEYVMTYVKSENWTPAWQVMLEYAGEFLEGPGYHVRRRLDHDKLYCGHCGVGGHECLARGITSAADLAPMIFRGA